MRHRFTVSGWMALLLIVAAPMTAAGAGGQAAPEKIRSCLHRVLRLVSPKLRAVIGRHTQTGGSLVRSPSAASFQLVAAPIDKRTTTHTFQARRHWLLLSTDGGSMLVELVPRRTTLTLPSRGSSVASVGAGGSPSHLARSTWLLVRAAPWAGLRLEEPVPQVGSLLASAG